MEKNLTKHQYMLIRGFVNSKTSSDFLPSYEKMLSAKSKGYPKEIMVTESHAEVELQSLLDYSASRRFGQ